MDNAVKLTGISKNFTSPHFPWQKGKITPALTGVSLNVEKGRCLGLLGPNGAGKTTLLKIISTLILPDKGDVLVDQYALGKNDEEIRSLIGLLITEERSFYWRLTGRQNLEFFASLYDLDRDKASSRIENLFKLFNIDYADKRFDSYSTGMKRKFALLRALLHDPPILLLDEPTKSLDLNSSQELRELTKDLIKKGKTIILATHNMAEAENLCDIFAILHKGKIYGLGTLKQLQEKIKSPSAGLSQIYLELTQND